eukprot:scaffold103217_cov17-Prasinocladus_malaysianus.AAC.1
MANILTMEASREFAHHGSGGRVASSGSALSADEAITPPRSTRYACPSCTEANTPMTTTTILDATSAEIGAERGTYLYIDWCAARLLERMHTILQRVKGLLSLSLYMVARPDGWYPSVFGFHSFLHS